MLITMGRKSPSRVGMHPTLMVPEISMDCCLIREIPRSSSFREEITQS